MTDILAVMRRTAIGLLFMVGYFGAAAVFVLPVVIASWAASPSWLWAYVPIVLVVAYVQGGDV